MGDKIPLTNERVVNVEGYFNLAETYYAVKNYLETERNYDLSEGDFTEKNDGNHRYLYSIMNGTFTYADYFDINVAIKLELSGEEVEVELDDKKTIFVKGRGKLVIGLYGDANWYEKRKMSPFMTFVTKMLDKYYGRDSMKKIKKRGNDDIEGLIIVFKRYVRSSL
jgi:phosphoribosylformylglycinamidine (FGAM) synthase-like amidotransferase family enzyme